MEYGDKLADELVDKFSERKKPNPTAHSTSPSKPTA